MLDKFKKNRFLVLTFCIFYVLCVVLLFLFHPFVASAKEPVPGGTGNKVVVNASSLSKNNRYVQNVTFQANENHEIVGYIEDMLSGGEVVSQNVFLRQYDPVSKKCYSLQISGLDDCTGFWGSYSDDTMERSGAYSMESFPNTFSYSTKDENVTLSFSISGCKLFLNKEALDAYVANGSLDGMLKDPEIDKSWYLKDLGYKVDAEDSPSGSGGEDATYITFSWSIDNLRDGDLLEIKTHNYLKKYGGDQISGFHDYITKSNSVSAYSGKYRFSQYEATKAWFKTLENKPLIFKMYDTDIYYLRPYRNGKVGGWVKVTMGRSTSTNSPYIEDIEVGDFNDDNEWETDDDLTEENGGHHGIDQGGNIFHPDLDNPFEGTNFAGIFNYFFGFFKNLPSLLGSLPALVNSVMGFLPPEVIGFISLGLVAVIILRIVGR